jgi:hypothetical protein
VNRVLGSVHLARVTGSNGTYFCPEEVPALRWVPGSVTGLQRRRRELDGVVWLRVVAEVGEL